MGSVVSGRLNRRLKGKHFLNGGSFLSILFWPKKNAARKILKSHFLRKSLDWSPHSYPHFHPQYRSNRNSIHTGSCSNNFLHSYYKQFSLHLLAPLFSLVLFPEQTALQRLQSHERSYFQLFSFGI